MMPVSLILLAGLLFQSDSTQWLLKTDGTQFPWVTEKYGWGGGYMDISGQTYEWTGDNPSDLDGPVRISVQRKEEGEDIVETYTFRNTSSRSVRLGNIGIYTPFNDSYPDAATCMEKCCHAHVWAGGKAAYVAAVKMNGKGPGLGLMVVKGEVTDYDIWERGNDKGWSNYRGVIALCPPDVKLRPGRSYVLSWRIFKFDTTGSGFEDAILSRGGTLVSSDRYVYRTGERCKVLFKTSKYSYTRSRRLRRPGEYRISRRGTYADVLAVPAGQDLLRARAEFILDNQQMMDPGDPRFGAYMVYDNETGAIVTDDMGRSDLDEGRERVGMGIFFAEYCRRHPSTRLLQSLEQYAKFVRTKLQGEDYVTTSSVSHFVPERGYNYPWIADFYFRMYELTGKRQYAADGYGTMMTLFRRFGYGFYCIDYPVTKSLRVLSDAGLSQERDSLLDCYRRTALEFIRNGSNFPSHEVNYEQSIVAPAVQLLCEMSLVLEGKESERCLSAAREMMPALEAFSFRQPSFRLRDIPIRHWDGWWFGKTQNYGDVFPHYWSVISAAAYHWFALASGDESYMAKAHTILRSNLASFFPDGSATCAYLYPRRINGVPGKYSDAYANDQDWALVAYLDFYL